MARGLVEGGRAVGVVDAAGGLVRARRATPSKVTPWYPRSSSSARVAFSNSDGSGGAVLAGVGSAAAALAGAVAVGALGGARR